mmetsp:Transcript_3584/g.7435  ORF Transcript_3584/g.7435 Transcript_3584/m.7435 type:complete len:206 (+) Transcript_3584:595-1212(+)
MVVGQGLLQPRDVAAEGEAVVPHQEAEIAIGQHPAEQVVADISRREVRRLVPVVVEDVVPVRERDHHGSHAHAVPVSRLHAHRLAALCEVAAEIHRRDVRLVADNPQSETGTGVPEALEVERHLEPAVEEPGVAADAQEIVVDALANVEDAPIFLELRVVHMAPPQQAEVDVQPKRHKLGNDHPVGEQGAHVGPNEVWAQVPKVA